MNKRYPIKISNDTFIMMYIYERQKNLEDMWFFDLIEKDDVDYNNKIENKYYNSKNTSQFAAQELIRQIGDECNGHFMEALIMESVKEYLNNHTTKENKEERLNEILNKIKELK
jgi:hypothetical protein